MCKKDEELSDGKNGYNKLKLKMITAARSGCCIVCNFY